MKRALEEEEGGEGERTCVVELELELRSSISAKNIGALKKAAALVARNRPLHPLQSLPIGDDALLRSDCQSLRVGDSVRPGVVLQLEEPDPEVFVFRVHDEPEAVEEGAAGDDDGDELPSFARWTLPNRAFDGLWESLAFEDDLKEALLRYAETGLVFSDAGVDARVVACNRVVVLHGPPGSGKTSVCQALAQKLAIRLSDRFASGLLVEINAHSLFSKWFSESGKLVARLFGRLAELVADRSAFVCVLIDEVESQIGRAHV